MKTALLISGYLRSFKANIPNLKSKIISKLENCDIYIHITKDEENQDKYLNNNQEETIKFIKESLNPKVLLYENNYFYDENIEKNNLLNRWMKLYKLNELKKINEAIFGFYDLVIKTRPDINFATEFNFNEYFDTNSICIPKDSKIDKKKLFKADDPYLCDIFSYGNSTVMDKYFMNYHQINELSKKYGFVSETLLFRHLQKEKIKYTLENIDYTVILSECNIFAICGDSGSGKSTLANNLKAFFSNSFLLECDRYHKWERDDEKWKQYTHLNPDANFITKMNEDIFSLKLGKNIYQVDYDHKNGKFTEKEEINSSDNIIVCGLHSLYIDNNQIYNLKIFMDTEDTLKHQWKLERDIKKRGYSTEKILKQIEDRKEDYEKYIVPQKEKSDIIIKFFNKEEKLCVKISLSKKYPIDKIIFKLSEEKIVFDIEENEFFNTFIFYEYIKNNLLQKLTLNNFYDYIIFFILHINKDLQCKL